MPTTIPVHLPTGKVVQKALKRMWRCGGTGWLTHTQACNYSIFFPLHPSMAFLLMHMHVLSCTHVQTFFTQYTHVLLQDGSVLRAPHLTGLNTTQVFFHLKSFSPFTHIVCDRLWVLPEGGWSNLTRHMYTYSNQAAAVALLTCCSHYTFSTDTVLVSPTIQHLCIRTPSTSFSSLSWQFTTLPEASERMRRADWDLFLFNEVTTTQWRMSVFSSAV